MRRAFPAMMCCGFTVLKVLKTSGGTFDELSATGTTAQELVFGIAKTGHAPRDEVLTPKKKLKTFKKFSMERSVLRIFRRAGQLLGLTA